MNLRRITFEHLLFTAAFVLALALRFANLGAAPLSDSEALAALQALAFAQGGSVAAGSNAASMLAVPQPAYVALTGVLFAFFGSSNFLARFWPALSGAMLALLPVLLLQLKIRFEPGLSAPSRPTVTWRSVAIVLAFGLAISPGLVAVSRLAGGPMMAVSFTLLAIGLGYTRRYLLAGFFGGLALLSGPAVISGILILGLTWTVAGLLNRTRKQDESTQDGETLPGKREVLALFGSMALTILIVGTFFFRYPQGLASWVETVPYYLRGWTSPSGVPVLRMLAALLVYEPIAVIFGLVGVVRGLLPSDQPRDRKIVYLCLAWIVIGLLATLAYPARQVADLAWVIMPFWMLAAWQISESCSVSSGEPIKPISILQAIVLVALMGLLWYSVASISRIQSGDTERLARLVVIVGILALGALITVLIQLGWSWETARLGLTWGILGGLFLFSISMLWGVAYLRPNQPQELWTPTPGVGQIGLFTQTLQDLSSRNTGRTDSIDIVSEVDVPSMRWVLRNFPNVRTIDPQDLNAPSVSSVLPSILITRQTQEEPSLTASYRGQDFTWWIHPGWSGALPANLAGWLAFRDASIQPESIILWARSDRFPGGTLSAPTTTEP